MPEILLKKALLHRKRCSPHHWYCCRAPGTRWLCCEAIDIAKEGSRTSRRVIDAGCVAVERLRAVSCVVVTVVVKERSKASGRVEAASVVGAHRINSISRVAVSQSVAPKGVPAYACIVALRTVSERLTDGCVVVNVGTAISAEIRGECSTPVVRLKSASSPSAVFRLA